MIVTAEEAKSKYCLRLVPGEKCRADECMAWRWLGGEFVPWKRGALVSEEKHIERIERERSDHEKRRRGFCGLAGKPEGMTKLDKALQNIAVAKRILVENSCPSEFGLKDCECEFDDSCCEDCWNEEVES